LANFCIFEALKYVCAMPRSSCDFYVPVQFESGVEEMEFKDDNDSPI